MRRALIAVLTTALVGLIGPVQALSNPTTAVGEAGVDRGQVMDPALVAHLATADPRTPITVFVDSAAIGSSVKAAGAAGLQVVKRFDQVGVAAATGTADAIRKVASDPTVTYVEFNAPISYDLNTAHVATRAEEARTLPGLLDGSLPYDGSGISIAINDSGVDGNHPMFDAGSGTKVARNVRQVCHPTVCDEWVDVSDSDQVNGHGTHVAGIAAGYQKQTVNGRTVRGAAPDATLIGLGSGAGLHILAATSGMAWVLDNHANPCGDGSCPPIKVINNSWTSGAGSFNPNSVVAQISNALVDAGVVVVFSAGNGDTTNNGGTGADNRVNSNAQNPKPGVIGVANYDDAGLGTRDGSLDSSSSRGLKTDPTTYPDISAPGSFILSACTYALPVCRSGADVTDPYYAEISGTSMSAPYVAGVVALLLEANPSLTPGQIEDILEDNAYQFGADYVADPRNADHTSSFDKGHGLIDVAAALGEVLAATVPPGPSCGAGAGIIDSADDATWVVVDAGLPSAVSEPTLDVVSGSIDTDPVTGALTFSVKVKDLRSTPPTGAGGEFFRYIFSHAGGSYLLAMQRVGGSVEAIKTFNVQENVLNGAVIGAVPGEFNVDTDTISAVVPANVFNAWKPALPVVASGDALSGLEILAQRRVGALTLSADSAAGACPYIVGT